MGILDRATKYPRAAVRAYAVSVPLLLVLAVSLTVAFSANARDGSSLPETASAAPGSGAPEGGTGAKAVPGELYAVPLAKVKDSAGAGTQTQPAAATTSGSVSGAATTADAGPPPAIVKETVLIDGIPGGRVDWSHANDMIAYSAGGSDGYTDVFTMNSDGSNQTCLTCGKPQIPQAHNDQPTWHSSGEWIVFQSLDPTLTLPASMQANAAWLTQGGAGINNNLWAMNRAGTQFYQLTTVEGGEGSLHPHFSEDGTKLLWSSLDDYDRYMQGWMLSVADFWIDGAGPHIGNIVSYRPNAQVLTFYEAHSFTPDGRSIVFSSNIGRANMYDLDIYRLELSTGALTQLTNTPGVWDEHGQVSPSGRKVAWVSSQAYSFTPWPGFRANIRLDLWIMDLDGTDQVRLTDKKTVPSDSSWNRDGTKLVVGVGIGNRGGVLPTARITVMEFNAPQ